MYLNKMSKIATREMAVSLIERYYEEEFPKTEAFIKNLIGDIDPELKAMFLEEAEKDAYDVFNDGKMLERLDEFEDKTVVLADLAGILENEEMPYESKEEYEMYVNFFIQESAEVLTDLLLVLHQAKSLVK